MIADAGHANIMSLRKQIACLGQMLTVLLPPPARPLACLHENRLERDWEWTVQLVLCSIKQLLYSKADDTHARHASTHGCACNGACTRLMHG
jgi:hypothetical protein